MGGERNSIIKNSFNRYDIGGSCVCVVWPCHRSICTSYRNITKEISIRSSGKCGAIPVMEFYREKKTDIIRFRSLSLPIANSGSPFKWIFGMHSVDE